MKGPRDGWAAGVTILVVSVCVAVPWAVLVLLLAFRAEPVQPEVAVIINATGGGLIAIVSGWLGLQRGRYLERNDPDKVTPHE